MYTPSFKPSFFKDIKKLPQNITKKLESVVDLIIQDPFSIKAQKLTGHTHLYRYRMGDYRLVYYVSTPLKKVVFLFVGHRKDIYKIVERFFH